MRFGIVELVVDTAVFACGELLATSRRSHRTDRMPTYFRHAKPSMCHRRRQRSIDIHALPDAMRHLLCAALTLTLAPAIHAADTTDPLTRPIVSDAAAKWNLPQTPLRIHGDTYYVGVAGLSSVLIHGKQGSILIDGALPQSAPEIEAHIRQLGFKVEDVKLILNSHAHFDHAGGIAALQRDSGAEVAASPSGAAALRSGRVVADDPQAGFSDNGFPPAARVREVRDGETVRIGDIAVTAHFTPGHTPGSTTWTWRSCEDGKCLDVVYVDSLNPVSAPGFHFLADATHPDLTAQLRKSIQTVASLPCDILISVHPEVSGADEKLKNLAAKPATNPFVDPQACRAYARTADKLLDARIEKEKAAHNPGAPGR
jgi:metallo-beta-lactamase class B